MDTKALQAEYAQICQYLKWQRYMPETEEVLQLAARRQAIEEIWCAHKKFQTEFPLTRLVVYCIPMVNMEALDHEVDLLNRRARKLGCPEIQLVKGPKGLEEYVAPMTQEEIEIANEMAQAGQPCNLRSKIVKAMAQLVEIVGEAPRLQGWELMGTLEQLPSGENVFRAVPQKSIPEQYRQADRHCDHCQADRRRKDVVLIRHTESGEFKQVGRQCVRDFFDGHDPKALMWSAERFFKIERLSSPGNIGAEEQYGIELLDFLAHVAQRVRQDGFYRTRQEVKYTDRQATVDMAMQCMYDRDRKRPYEAPIEQDRDVALKAMEWVRSRPVGPGSEEFMQNLRALFSIDYTNRRGIGMAGWAIKGYLKEVEKRATELQRLKVGENSGHVGTVGKRETFQLRFFGQHVFESQYGVMVVLKFLDPQGNLLVWMTAESSNYPDMEQGALYSVKGTVKRHNDYKGVLQTQLSRVMIGEKLEAPRVKEVA